MASTLRMRQPYHPGSGSLGQLFRPCYGSSAWHYQHGHIYDYRYCLYYRGECKSTPLNVSSIVHTWYLVRNGLQFPANSYHMCTVELSTKAGEGATRKLITFQK